MRITSLLLEALAALMEQTLRFDRPADRVLSDYFRARPKLGQTERAFLAETVYAGLRRKRLIDLILDETATEHDAGTPWERARRFALATLVRLRGANLRELEQAVRDDEEFEWLASVKGAVRGELPFAVAVELPDWVIARLDAAMPRAELEALARALQQPAPLDLRVNLMKMDRDEAARRMAADGIDVQPTPYSPTGLRLGDKPALHRHPLFLDGSIEVQDEGSQLLACLVAPRRGEMVGDFCAGAGGKTLALAAMMRSTGRLYAFDVSDKRLAKLKPRLARSGVSNIDMRHIDSERDVRLARLAGKLDRVLVDAPCSGLGTLRRNPDLKWRQQESGLAELIAKQAAILRAAARLVKPGGRLVYATCSLLPEENEAVVRAFLAEQPQFVLMPVQPMLAAQRIEVPHLGDDGFLRLLPHTHGTDGFFAAVMELAK